MPGRGQPWKKGGHIDETIDTGDIVDGTIKEVDLDSALQAKVNSAGGHQIQEEGSPLTQRTELNFVGEGVTASDDGEKTVVTIPLGGGGGISRIDVAEPNTDFYYYDEMYYVTPATDFPHLEGTTSTGFFDQAIVAESPSAVGGVVRLTTASGFADKRARVNTCGAGLVNVDITKKFRVTWRGRIRTTLANTALVCGLTPNQNEPSGSFPFSSQGDPAITFFFNGTGNWLAETRDGASPQSNDTGVAGDLLFHTFEIDFEPVGTVLTFKIDGATVHTQTTNIPTGTLAVMWIVQTSNTTAGSSAIDSLFIFNER